MMPAKMATPDFLKIKVFWNKGYDVKIFILDVINKVLSRDSNHIVDEVNFYQSLITIAFLRESYHNFSFIKIWLEKYSSLRGDLGSGWIIYDWY